MGFEQDDLVSIWIGSLEKEERLEELMEEDYESEDDEPISEFGRSFEINWYDHDYLEAEFAENSSVRGLLETISFSSSFIEDACRAARSLLTGPVNTVICLFDFNYETGPVPSAAGLRFIGSFDYDKTAASVREPN